MFIRQLRRRDESGHAVFHMQKKSQSDARKQPCLEHRKTERTYGENTRIEVRTFQRILKDTNKLEFMQIHICDD